jgi:hypothetical protein
LSSAGRRLLCLLALAAVAVPAAATAATSPAQRAVQVAKASLKGQHAVRWAALHPKYQAVVSKARFVACERRNAAALGRIAVVSVDAEGTSVFHTAMPALGKVDVNDVTLAVAFRRGAGKPLQLAEVESLWVLYKGRWVHLYSPEEYNAYKAGKCP